LIDGLKYIENLKNARFFDMAEELTEILFDFVSKNRVLTVYKIRLTSNRKASIRCKKY